MNIFYLHHNPRICAKWHCDSHVVKMILELAQLLCTAIWMCGGTAHCKPTHKNHPSAVWVRTNKSNWLWTKELALELCKEYTARYDKKHALEEIIRALSVPELPEEPFFEPPQAMPDDYKVPKDSITAYRNYYILGKSHLHFHKYRHAWKRRSIPKFILNVLYVNLKDSRLQ